MFAVILAPDFPLQALLRGQSQARPTVVLEDAPAAGRGRSGRGGGSKARVISLNEQAAQTGVHPGMTAPQAQARCGDLRVLTRDRVEEQAVYEAFLAAVEEHCADMEATETGMVTVDLFGCRRGGEDWATFGRRILGLMGRALRLDLVMGVASTPDQARLGAEASVWAGTSLTMLPSDASSVLGREPVSLLRPSPPLLEVFQLWGVDTIGQFLALPREEVGERLGAEAAALWDLVRGKRRRLLKLRRAPEVYEHLVTLDYELETVEPLLFLVRRSLELLLARLRSRYLVAAQVEVALLLNDGRREEERFRLPDPTNAMDLLYRVVERRLENVSPSAPVTGMGLALVPHRSVKRQTDLFQSALSDPNRFACTLAELEALLGSERVGRPRIQATHRADGFVLDPAERTMDRLVPGTVSEGDGSAPPAVALGLPLRRCRPPMPVQVRGETLAGVFAPSRLLDGPFPGFIRAVRGPWKSSGHWWEKEGWSREEWDVELDEGRLCRLLREGEDWYLEGIYG